MSRPILSRPRTRVYGCNYDKGESYYKPMVDHLDRKYSSRPLFSEPRNSFADEIAARRSDIGSRSLAGSRIDDSYDDPEFFDERGPTTEEPCDIDEFLIAHRRQKERAAEAFERDLAELRQKRREMQDKMFDMIDITSEIERAKTMLDGANSAFQKHAIKFDNSDYIEPVGVTIAAKIDKNRKIQAATAYFDTPQETPRPNKKPTFAWTKMEEIEKYPPGLVEGIYNRRARINSLIADEALTNRSENNVRDERPVKAPKERTKKKRSVSQKRKKSVSF